jgi:hypothetical protein
MLAMTPEAVRSAKGKRLLESLSKNKSDLLFAIVIDECQCLIEWGDTFRPGIRELRLLKSCVSLKTRMGLFSGSLDGTRLAKLEDEYIKRSYNPKRVIVDCYRTNICWLIRRMSGGISARPDANMEELMPYIIRMCNGHLKQRKRDALRLCCKQAKRSHITCQDRFTANLQLDRNNHCIPPGVIRNRGVVLVYCATISQSIAIWRYLHQHVGLVACIKHHLAYDPAVSVVGSTKW